MSRINDHYLSLPGGYLFPEISRRVRAFEGRNPGVQPIRLGIGDVVLPLPPSVCEAMHRAVDEMGTDGGFRGYGPEQGYGFLREAIAAHDFGSRGVEISPDEVFVSDGSKCDSANIQEIFSVDASIAVPDPVYPVYLDTNVMAGRAGTLGADGRFQRVTYLPCTQANGFRPEPPASAVDLVYLCSPNNPTGSVTDRAALEEWVRYAQRHRAILLFDAAYESYITEPQIPHSIFEIPGAREVAIEFRSYSKSAGFTGTRCAYIVIPQELQGRDAKGEPVSIHRLWTRRHTTKFNGVSYPVQAGAAAIYSDRGRAEVRERIDYYLANARLIRDGLSAAGLTVFGGINAPYIWVQTPRRMGSWDFFDQLLEGAHVVVTPGAGFGTCGEGYFRVSAFGKRPQIETAVERIKQAIVRG